MKNYNNSFANWQCLNVFFTSILIVYIFDAYFLVVLFLF